MLHKLSMKKMTRLILRHLPLGSILKDFDNKCFIDNIDYSFLEELNENDQINPLFVPSLSFSQASFICIHLDSINSPSAAAGFDLDLSM